MIIENHWKKERVFFDKEIDKISARHINNPKDRLYAIRDILLILLNTDIKIFYFWELIIIMPCIGTLYTICKIKKLI